MKQHIKLNKKVGNLGTHIQTELAKSKITVTSDVPFSKRYVVFLNFLVIQHELNKFLVRGIMMTYPKYNELESLTKLDVWINLRKIQFIITFAFLDCVLIFIL